MKKYTFLFLAALTIIGMMSCKKEKEDFQTDGLNEYFPLEPGKYITYALDSVVTVNFGASFETHSYEVKYQVDALTTDNMGRPAYRIFRYIRPSSTGNWSPDATFLAVHDTFSIEFIENNFRYIKLHLPLRDGFSWKGNSFIDTYSVNSPVRYLDDWDYVYENVGMPNQIGNFSLDKTLTVNQRDETIGNPADPVGYTEVNFSQEKYAAGIGMVYRNFLHTEYQPPTTTGGTGYYTDASYGLIYTMIDHN